MKVNNQLAQFSQWTELMLHNYKIILSFFFLLSACIVVVDAALPLFFWLVESLFCWVVLQFLLQPGDEVSSVLPPLHSLCWKLLVYVSGCGR